MPSIPQLTRVAGLATLLISLSANAGDITGDSFTATMADDIFGPIELDGSTAPVSGTAGAAGIDLVSNRLEIDWVDADSFQLRVILGEDLVNLKISLQDLNFKVGATPVNITGVTFDDANTPQETYNGFEGIAGPSVAFTADSIEVGFGIFPLGPAADAIPWQFNVTTSGTTAVPETLSGATLWMVFGGLALLRRQLQKR